MLGRDVNCVRNTKETKISIDLSLDGKGISNISTGIGFFNHMLETFSKHGLFDLYIRAEGDLFVDQHHTIEDVGICLGEAFSKALGDKKGINRAGCFFFPMDEALSVCAVDIGGRPYLKCEVKVDQARVGDFDTINVPNFFFGFVQGARINLHIIAVYGEDPHHEIESCFKAFGRAMREACSLDQKLEGCIPSTKGVI